MFGVMFALALSSSSATAAPRPHLLAMLADDLGYYDTAIHNPASPTPASVLAGGRYSAQPATLSAG